MKPIEEIFGEHVAHAFNQDDYHAQAEENIFIGGRQRESLIETAMKNIDETPGLGEGYAKRNPVLLAGIILAMILDHNTRHLVSTLQVGCAVQMDTMQKNHEAILEELREIRKAIESMEAVKSE